MRAQGLVSAVAETAAGCRRIADQVAQTAGPAGDRASAGRRDSLGARGTQRKPLHSFRRDGGPPFEFRAGTRPELRIPATQLKREWSLSLEFGWIPANLCDFQGDNLRRRFTVRISHAQPRSRVSTSQRAGST